MTLLIALEGLWHSKCQRLNALPGLMAWHDITHQASLSRCIWLDIAISSQCVYLQELCLQPLCLLKVHSCAAPSRTAWLRSRGKPICAWLPGCCLLPCLKHDRLPGSHHLQASDHGPGFQQLHTEWSADVPGKQLLLECSTRAAAFALLLYRWRPHGWER